MAVNGGLFGFEVFVAFRFELIATVVAEKNRKWTWDCESRHRFPRSQHIGSSFRRTLITFAEIASSSRELSFIRL